jgi:hypothetical protein
MWKAVWETLKRTKILKDNKEEETSNTKFFLTPTQNPRELQCRNEKFDLRCNWELNRRLSECLIFLHENIIYNLLDLVRA